MTADCFEISLEDIRLRGNHGVFPQERKVGNEFKIDVKVRIPVPVSIKSDALTDTISYADIYEVVATEFCRPSNLLEHVCWRIEEELRKKWPQIQSGEIKIVKIQPPIDGIIGSTSVKKFF